jgi:uncharacterized membrane protein YgcG
MIVFAIIMAVVGFGGILAVRIWRKRLQARRATVIPQPDLQKRAAEIARLQRDAWYPPEAGWPGVGRHPGINPISYVEKPRTSSEDDSNSLLNTIVAAEIISSVESSSSSSSDSSSWSDSSSSSDSSPSSDFTSGGDSGGGGASGDW